MKSNQMTLIALIRNWEEPKRKYELKKLNVIVSSWALWFPQFVFLNGGARNRIFKLLVTDVVFCFRIRQSGGGLLNSSQQVTQMTGQLTPQEGESKSSPPDVTLKLQI